MATTIYLLAWMLTAGQVVERGDWQLSPHLAQGLELTYSGTYTEESLIPNVQFQRQYRLDVVAFVLGSAKGNADLAVMTTLGLVDPRQKVVPAVPHGPESVRLEMLRVDNQGRVRTTDGKLLHLPTAGAATVEAGFLAEVPLARVNKNHAWQVAADGMPPRAWQVEGVEACGGITCIKLSAQQESNDWARPRGDQTAWRRKDTIWLFPQYNVAQKVERIIERRAPLREAPTQRAIVRYELVNHVPYPYKFHADRLHEIEAIRKFQEEAAPLLRQPAQHRAQLDALTRKVAFQLESPSGTPYRKALTHLKQDLDRAKNGELTSVETRSDEPRPLIRPIELGERVPDFVVTSLTEHEPVRFKRYLGKPTLVLFYNPATKIGREVITHARGLVEQHRGDLQVMALAVTADPDLARKQHAELKLPFPIHDGQAMRLTLGAQETPRLLLLDGQGTLRWAQTGWGWATPAEIAHELSQCPRK